MGSDEPIRVECQPGEGGPRFAIVLGKKAKIKGLWLCDDGKTCVLFERGQQAAIAQHLQSTARHFRGRRRTSPNDLERARRLAAPRAARNAP